MRLVGASFGDEIRTARWAAVTLAWSASSLGETFTPAKKTPARSKIPRPSSAIATPGARTCRSRWTVHSYCFLRCCPETATVMCQESGAVQRSASELDRRRAATDDNSSIAHGGQGQANKETHTKSMVSESSAPWKSLGARRKAPEQPTRALRIMAQYPDPIERELRCQAYDYQCSGCGCRFEVRQKMSDQAIDRVPHAAAR